ncbi:MAG: prepilin-type N-terminal cleavage/methylation domain-containing protein [Armatimonadetes bacterium]|jgi:prepilin-type N-terminal cleavage/methylation domain-containing protein|nr:prepilin-type N-terminal cleavage/methylation domain-containing protein [Armatimonadota bacterium]
MRILETGRKRSTRPAGFTVIELCVVLTLLAIAASAVLPAYPQYVRSQRLKATASQLASAIRYASEWSALHEWPVLLSYDEGRHLFTLAAEETDPTEELLARPVPADGEQKEEEMPELDSAWHLLRLPVEVTLEGHEVGEAGSGGPPELRFLPDGRCDDALFVLGAGDLRRSVRVDGRRGRVVVEDGDALANAPEERADAR